MKIAFVTPWYGKDIPGGAELECRKTALHLMQIGIDVEILTTRVKDFHSDWSKNFHTATISNDDGLVVRRFKVKRRNNSAFDRINQKLLCANSDLAFLFNNKASPIRYCEEEVFIQEMINCPSLYKYIRKNKDQYDFFVFIPYMFGTTYYGSIECHDNALLIPCLHNEPYAYMDIYKEMFSRFKGFLFHVKSEETLAKYLYNIEDDRTYLIGEGVETDIKYKPDRFLQKYKIDVPFLLYVGRKDRTKNTHLLIEYFSQYKQRNKNNLKLILVGPGYIELLPAMRDSIIDLGYIDKNDMYDAYSAATALCQPSINESFSFVLMESWLTETPVLVHENCQTTKEHCIAGNGGLFFQDFHEFESCVNHILTNSHEAKLMGQSGRAYVLDNYSRDENTAKYMQLLTNLKAKLNKPVVNIMTAGLNKGDAIGNYIFSLKKILLQKGYFVQLYADSGDPKLNFSTHYRSTGKNILWFHYSIFSKNLNCIKSSIDFRIMDFHGVSPPHLFSGYNRLLEELVAKGRKLLTKFVDDFDLCIVHSDYTLRELKSAGYRNIIKIPLVADDHLIQGDEDESLRNLLPRIKYLLFVGRIVPQKNLTGIINLFGELNKLHPELFLIIVGDNEISDAYNKEIMRLIQNLKLEESVVITGKITNRGVLGSLYRHAKFLIIISEWESFCVPIVESMQFDVPVIGAANACIPETIGNAGLLLPNLDDSQKNAAIISRYLADNKEYQKLRKKCRQRAGLFKESELKKNVQLIIEEYFPDK